MQSWLRSLVFVAPLVLAAPARADFLVGMVAYGEGDFATAFAELSKPDTRDSAEAQNYLGRMYLLGQGVEADPAKGIELMEQAAAGDVVEAVVFLAQAYQVGMGVPKDPVKAQAYWRQAAELGVTKAQLELGLQYERGEIGGAPDYEKAAEYYRAVAATNDARGLTLLGHLYERGLGVPQDKAYAAQLYRQAIDKGLPLAMNRMALMLLADGGDLGEAQGLAEAATAAEGQPAFYDTLGRILQARGDGAAAEQAFREAARRSPLYLAPREALGDLLWSQGRRLEAQAAWKEALEVARQPADQERLERKLEQATRL